MSTPDLRNNFSSEMIHCQDLNGCQDFSRLAPLIENCGVTDHLKTEVHDSPLFHSFDNNLCQHSAANMATELTVQSERAYQKQPHIFLNQKAKATKSKKSSAGRRWYKDVGLGFRTPKTAISGSYIGQCIWKTRICGSYNE